MPISKQKAGRLPPPRVKLIFSPPSLADPFPPFSCLLVTCLRFRWSTALVFSGQAALFDFLWVFLTHTVLPYSLCFLFFPTFHSLPLRLVIPLSRDGGGIQRLGTPAGRPFSRLTVSPAIIVRLRSLWSFKPIRRLSWGVENLPIWRPVAVFLLTLLLSFSREVRHSRFLPSSLFLMGIGAAAHPRRTGLVREV